MHEQAADIVALTCCSSFDKAEDCKLTDDVLELVDDDFVADDVVDDALEVTAGVVLVLVDEAVVVAG